MADIAHTRSFIQGLIDSDTHPAQVAHSKQELCTMRDEIDQAVEDLAFVGRYWVPIELDGGFDNHAIAADLQACVKDGRLELEPVSAEVVVACHVQIPDGFEIAWKPPSLNLDFPEGTDPCLRHGTLSATVPGDIPTLYVILERSQSPNGHGSNGDEEDD